MKPQTIEKPVLYLLLIAMIGCSKQTSWCERWEVEVMEKKDGLTCMIGKKDTVTACFNSKDHESMAERIDQAYGTKYYWFKRKL